MGVEVKMDSVRLMANAAKALGSREEVMRAFAAGDFEALGRHYYALALKEAFGRFHLLGDEALDLAQEVAAHVLATLKAWKEGRRKLPNLASKNLTFWVMVEVDRAVREYFYRTRGTGYTNSRLVARVKRVAEDLKADLGREPTPEEIAERLGVPEEVVEEAKGPGRGGGNPQPRRHHRGRHPVRGVRGVRPPREGAGRCLLGPGGGD
jgi:RNA polymerase primary sigma factor